jgi:hypothetical protein
MALRPGVRLKSAVDDTEVIVVRPPKGDIELWCGGHPMLDSTAASPLGLDVAPAHGDGTELGKRYADPDSGIEVLCTRAGRGSLSLGATPLPLKDAKPLPASD